METTEQPPMTEKPNTSENTQRRDKKETIEVVQAPMPECRNQVVPASSVNPMAVVQLGLDDGYAYTKLALADGRLFAIPSRARIGHAGVTWMHEEQQRIFEYESKGTIYSVGAVDGDPTHFDGYAVSGLNRAIVQHALQSVGLAGKSLHLVSGLPVGAFYRGDGQQRTTFIQQKRDNLEMTVQPLSRQSDQGKPVTQPACIAFHEVVPEALAAWYDHVILTCAEGVTLDADRVASPIAIVDIGGRTTDYVVVQDQGVVHSSSGSLNRGLLDVKTQVAQSIRDAFDLETVSEQRVAVALEQQSIRLHGKEHDVSELVSIAQGELVERLYTETRRLLGQGAELDRILFVGGGSAALAEDIANWFPNQSIAEHPAFANARGMLKYLQYVCDEQP